MKVVNTWHSSTAIQGRIELNRGRVLRVKLNMPQDKIEILDVKTSFFRLHGFSENIQRMLDKEEKTINVCSGSRLAKVTGLELCVDVSYVNASLVEHAPYFPFTGPFDMEVSLNKRDKHSGYNMLAKRSESKTASTIQFAFDTPGSSIDRTLAFDLSVNYKKKQVDMSFVSPWKNIAVKGKQIYFLSN
ncbi:apolipophorins-like [Gigantopelta aegis]|uniref:apolipophorins-like n=1 Tax=Gigantopelta aegis TaxID=1735272 RepID=UPI001B88C49F|nr:apolipophorins-like [Gigantopelta aegis]